MTSMTITVVRTGNSPSVTTFEDFINNGGTYDGIDNATLKSQSTNCFNLKLSPWDDSRTIQSHYNSDNCLVETVVSIVSDISTVPGLTEANAVEMMDAARQSNSRSAGYTEFVNARIAYRANNFTTTSTVTVSG